MVCVQLHSWGSKDRNNSQNYSSLNPWATLMKQKPNYSQYVEQKEDIFRYVKNSELTRKIRCHSDWIFPHLHQCYYWYSPTPLSNYILFLAIHQCLRVFQDVVVKFWHVCNLRLPFHFDCLKIQSMQYNSSLQHCRIMCVHRFKTAAIMCIRTTAWNCMYGRFWCNFETMSLVYVIWTSLAN